MRFTTLFTLCLAGVVWLFCADMAGTQPPKKKPPKASKTKPAAPVWQMTIRNGEETYTALIPLSRAVNVSRLQQERERQLLARRNKNLALQKDELELRKMAAEVRILEAEARLLELGHFLWSTSPCRSLPTCPDATWAYYPWAYLR